MMDGAQRTPVALLSDVLAQASRIMRGELALAQAEVTVGLRSVAVGLGMVVGAVVLAITALNVLAGALIAAIAHAGLGPAWAAVVVGIGFAVVAGVLAWTGIRALKASALVPTRALHSMQRNMDALNEGWKV